MSKINAKQKTSMHAHDLFRREQIKNSSFEVVIGHASGGNCLRELCYITKFFFKDKIKTRNNLLK